MNAHHPLLALLVAAVLAPLVAQTPAASRVPVVVLEVLLGVLIGPHVLRWVEFGPFFEVMASIGMVGVLFMAGTEVDFGRIRGRPLSLAALGWMGSLAIALSAVAVLQALPPVHAPIMVALALCTTGLGMLLPALRDGGELDRPFGRFLLAAGVAGEVGPIVAVSLALSTRYSTWQEFAYLLLLLGLVTLAAVCGVKARPPRVIALLATTMHASTQLPVRIALLVVGTMIVLAQEMGFEGVLGAFAAGMVIGFATRGGDGEEFRTKMDAICFGWISPFFYNGTGVSFDIGALTRDATTMWLVAAFLALFLVVRGLPVILYRRALDGRERLSLALSSGVASLGLVVVIAEIGVRRAGMSREIAQALVGAALLALLLYPTLANCVNARHGAANPPGGPP